MELSGHDGEITIPLDCSFLGGNGDFPSINGPPSTQAPTPLSTATPFTSKKSAMVKYRECLKNHAAAIGGNATDGCGEFMPSGEEGTIEALKCTACDCHRNFHRKEIEGEMPSSDCFHFNGSKKMGQKGVLISGNSLVLWPFSHQATKSDEIGRKPMGKKRFRTKFSQEQKEKMMGFAEKIGWKIQKEEESFVQEFCQEIGVKRRVLKVWMHNNKHNLGKKNRNLQLE